MKTLRNEKGFALVFVLILAVIALILTLAMLSMVSRGSFVSGQMKRFRTAVEASQGGMEAMFQLISNGGIPMAWTLVPPVIDNPTGVQTKLAGPINTWTTGLDNTITIVPDTPSTYDMRIDLGTYRVYAKVVDTVVGNTGVDLGLLKSGVVSTSSSEVSGLSVPYLYTIEVLSQSQVNPTERSKLSVLYQY